MSTIRIALAADRNYWHLVPTLLGSVLRRTSDHVEAHVLTRDIESETLRHASARAKCARLTLHCHGCAWDLPDAKLLPWVTASTLDRLFLPQHLEDLNRVIYLDMDTIVLADLAPLMAVDCGSRGIAAKASVLENYRRLSDAFGAFGCGNLGETATDCDCFNAGVLVLDLQTLRELNFTQTCLDPKQAWFFRPEAKKSSKCASVLGLLVVLTKTTTQHQRHFE